MGAVDPQREFDALSRVTGSCQSTAFRPTVLSRLAKGVDFTLEAAPSICFSTPAAARDGAASALSCRDRSARCHADVIGRFDQYGYLILLKSYVSKSTSLPRMPPLMSSILVILDSAA